MSSRSVHRLSAICLLLLTSSLGCWEQWSEAWFPQMKWQKAVQPFERVAFRGRDAAFLPPEGSVPVQGYEPSVGRLDIVGTDALVNPRDATDFRSVANGGGDVVHKKMDKKLAKALTAAFIKSVPDLRRKVPFAKHQLYGSIDAKQMAICYANGTKPNIRFHEGAIEAWEEAGHKVPDCAR